MEKVVFDEETRAKLAGLLPFSPDAVGRLEPKIFEEMGVDPKYRPVFFVGVMTNGQKEKAQSGQLDSEGISDLARMVVTGWENVLDLATGELVKYKKAEDGGVDKELWALIPDGAKFECMRYSNKLSGIASWDRLGLG